ncbi:hypothetical protein QYF61_016081 [Mycteria americana]|uniref:Uncharacterized protein n=1 Tax=Mycteria americana TaxID=33587 RepID=A0AAN7RM17_MYCAM|nr:hypothetical protein QYF61_016081 [Mycteria americana]
MQMSLFIEVFANKSRIMYRPYSLKNESWMFTRSRIHPNNNNIAAALHIESKTWKPSWTCRQSTDCEWGEREGEHDGYRMAQGGRGWRVADRSGGEQCKEVSSRSSVALGWRMHPTAETAETEGK